MKTLVIGKRGVGFYNARMFLKCTKRIKDGKTHHYCSVAEKNTLYRCLDKRVAHKDELFKFLCARWGEMFGAKIDVLLYDLTSTYFESDTIRDPGDKRQYGYSRDKRFDCRQAVIALIVTPEGFPLIYEVLAGNTKDSATLSDFLKRIEERYGHADRIWVMDRGVPTEQSLEQMRRKRVRRYVARLKELQTQTLTRDQLSMKVGAAKKEAGRAAGLIELQLPDKDAAVTKETFHFKLNRAKLRQVRAHEGRYLLRTNLSEHDPDQL